MKTTISRREFSLTVAAGTLGLITGCSTTNRFDILIKNGLIIDGSGAQSLKNDIGIIGNKIVAIDDLKNSTADVIIDAVCKYYNVDVKDLLIFRRGVVNQLRNVAIYLLCHARNCHG